MEKLQQLRELTRFYPHFQGLRLVPWGVAVLIPRLLNLGEVWPAYLNWEPFSTMAVFILAGWAVWMIDRYYRQLIGYSKPLLQAREPFFVIFFLVGLFIAGGIDRQLTPPVSLFNLWLGIGLLVPAFQFHRAHYAIAGSLLLMLSILPAFGSVSNMQAYFLGGWVMGISFCVLGFIDHYWFTRRLQDIRTQSEA